MKKLNVLVSGDTSVDWNLTCPGAKASETSSFSDVQVHSHPHPGGSALLTQILKEVVSRQGHRVTGPTLSVTSISPLQKEFSHGHAIWRNFRQVWRVDEFLGLDRRAEGAIGGQETELLEEEPLSSADVVVLDDANLGFRDADIHGDVWESLAQCDSPPWIVLKMSSVVCKGRLWDELLKHHSDRLILIMTVRDLRAATVQISHRLSWERTAQDIVNELAYNPRVAAASKCRHIIVSCGTAGAVLQSRNDGAEDEIVTSRSQLIFDPRSMEGDRTNPESGLMLGYASTLTAGVVARLLANLAEPNRSESPLVTGIAAGLEAGLKLHRNGYTASTLDAAKDGKERIKLDFPYAGIADAIMEELEHRSRREAVGSPSNPKSALRLSDVLVRPPICPLNRTQPPKQSPAADTNCDITLSNDVHLWTILCEKHAEDLQSHSVHADEVDADGGDTEPGLGLAARIVLHGLGNALNDVPLGRFAKLTTADRHEIEALRGIHGLMEQYCRERHNKPLSIAVFGPPGSGKSFAVKQVASTAGGDMIETLEFNLSQFAHPEELYGAFHQVRDSVLKGKVPLVFWDEFDSRLGDVPLGWLRYFLAPMQDGQFLEGQISHPIGKAIFVFAGGTSASLQEFADSTSSPAGNTESTPEKVQREEKRRAAKVPDFLSRLKGFLNILGPEQAKPTDILYKVRRAILLRSVLWLSRRELFDGDLMTGTVKVDRGIVRAFLETSRFEHGARSIDSIVAMSNLAGKSEYQRASLPPRSQLNLHVDDRQFMALVQMHPLPADVLDDLAAQIHDGWYRDQKAAGWEWGEVHDAAAKRSPLLVAYTALPADVKQQNRDQACDIPYKLAHLGYLMVRKDHAQQMSHPVSEEELEQLAKREHDRWMALKYHQGWRYGKPRDDVNRLHPCMLPWEDLPEEEKDKDRSTVKPILGWLEEIGYVVVAMT